MAKLQRYEIVLSTEIGLSGFGIIGTIFIPRVHDTVCE